MLIGRRVKPVDDKHVLGRVTDFKPRKAVFVVKHYTDGGVRAARVQGHRG